MVFDIVRGVTVLYGGNNFTLNTNVWEWDGTDWTEVSAFLPGFHSMHNMVFDFSRRQTVLFGGVIPGGDASNKTWT